MYHYLTEMDAQWKRYGIADESEAGADHLEEQPDGSEPTVDATVDATSDATHDAAIVRKCDVQYLEVANASLEAEYLSACSPVGSRCRGVARRLGLQFRVSRVAGCHGT